MINKNDCIAANLQFPAKRVTLSRDTSLFFGNMLILPLPQRLNSWVLPFSDVFSQFSDI